MSIFDRLGRLARAEINQMKRSLSDSGETFDDAFSRTADEVAYQNDIAAAERELARDHGDALEDIGASVWGNPTRDVSGQRGEIERGASMWGAAAEDAPIPPVPPVTPPPRTKNDRPATQPYEGRTSTFPREVREAYAALELPLGAEREAVEKAFRDLLHRYHPDKHANDPKRLAIANDLTIRIREARAILVTWVAREP